MTDGSNLPSPIVLNREVIDRLRMMPLYYDFSLWSEADREQADQAMEHLENVVAFIRGDLQRANSEDDNITDERMSRHERTARWFGEKERMRWCNPDNTFPLRMSHLECVAVRWVNNIHIAKHGPDWKKQRHNLWDEDRLDNTILALAQDTGIGSNKLRDICAIIRQAHQRIKEDAPYVLTDTDRLKLDQLGLYDRVTKIITDFFGTKIDIDPQYRVVVSGEQTGTLAEMREKSLGDVIGTRAVEMGLDSDDVVSFDFTLTAIVRPKEKEQDDEEELPFT